MVPITSNDILQWEAFKKGDVDAYALIYSENVSAMYRYGMSLASISEYFVFDCIHDVFTEIWAKRTTISTPANVKSYLFRALKRASGRLKTIFINKGLKVQITTFKDFVNEEAAVLQQAGFQQYFQFTTQPSMVFDIPD